jgi:hypothetical protein
MALTRVQGTGRVSVGSGTSIALTFATPPAAGSGIIVLVSNYSGSGVAPPTTGCTDNRGHGAYPQAIQRGAGLFWATIHYLPVVVTSAAPFTITVAAANSGAWEATAIEVAGVGTGLAVDQVAGQSGTSPAVSTGPTAALAAAAVVVAAVHAIGGNQSSIVVQTVSPAWTEEFENLNYSATIAGEGDMRIVTGAAGTTQTCSWTDTGSFAYAAALAAFKAVAPSGGGSSPYAAAVIADGASHYWRLGEPSGTVAADSIAGGANAPGTISGGVTLGQPGPLADGATAMTFDGTSGKIDVVATVTIPLAAATLEAWIKTGSLTYQACLSTRNRAAGTTIFFGLHLTGHPQIFTDAPAALDPGGIAVIADTAWHHLVAVFTEAAVTWYVDGGLDPGGGFLARAAASVGPLFIGWESGNGWLGALAEVAIYPTALTAPTIAAHYALRTATGGGGGARPAFPWEAALMLPF